MRGAGEQGSLSLMPLRNCSSVNAVSLPSNSATGADVVTAVLVQEEQVKVALGVYQVQVQVKGQVQVKV